MEQILSSLTDDQLSRVGRFREESAALREREAKHQKQIATLEVVI